MTEKLPAEALEIIEALPADGSTLGNGRLREQLGHRPNVYRDAAVRLKDLGLVMAGRGRGGTLALSDRGQQL